MIMVFAFGNGPVGIFTGFGVLSKAFASAALVALAVAAAGAAAGGVLASVLTSFLIGLGDVPLLLAASSGSLLDAD